MRFPIYTLLILFFSSHLFAQQTINDSFTHDGETRAFTVYIPASYTVGDSWPLVINMHGYGSNNIQQIVYSAFNTVADTANCIVVYPQGLVGTTSWGDTDTHFNSYFGTGVDDLGFLDRLIDKMHGDYNVDLKRVYSTGMSNGGYMSYVLACELSDRIAAIASVTGAMTVLGQASCNPQRAVPVMEVHGTLDLVVPYNGSAGFTLSAPAAVNYWVNNNNCTDSPSPVNVPDIDMTDNCTASYVQYTNCDDDSEVLFYTIADGGHSWPGAFFVADLGNVNGDFHASAAIWDFFNRHEHPNPRPYAPLGISNGLDANDFVRVFPNPANEIMQIEFKTNKVNQLTLRNIIGQEILQLPVENLSNLSIDLSAYPKGIYFIEIATSSGKALKKIIIQ